MDQHGVIQPVTFLASQNCKRVRRINARSPADAHLLLLQCELKQQRALKL